MKNWIKTAIATGAIALNVVVAQAASAARFSFSKTLSNGVVINGEVEGSLGADNNTVFDGNLIWWGVEEVDGSALVEKQNADVTEYVESVGAFSLDGSHLDIDLWAGTVVGSIIYVKYSGGSFEGLDVAHSSSVFITDNLANVVRPALGTGYNISDATDGANGWTAEMIEGNIESVPEPSLIIGSLLALAAGTKVLKRGNQK